MTFAQRALFMLIVAVSGAMAMWACGDGDGGQPTPVTREQAEREIEERLDELRQRWDELSRETGQMSEDARRRIESEIEELQRQLDELRAASDDRFDDIRSQIAEGLDRLERGLDDLERQIAPDTSR
ncbi:MAG: hypothetical protein RMK67_09770 [Chloroflexota bacterium]|nr:hypothetical protein [Chloroflexota bacterium]